MQINEADENDELDHHRHSYIATDIIQRIIGSYGKYHLCLSMLIFISKLPVAFHLLSIIFLAPKVTYTCGIKGEICPCPNPIYNTSIFTSSIITEWNLICGRKWLASFTQTMFHLGVLLGSVLFGMASDRFGRKNPMIWAIILQVSSGIIASYIPEFWTFTFVRFLIGISVGGSMVVGFVILMEFVGTKHRDIISALYQAPINIGHMLLAVFGYFFRDYADFQLAISLPTILLLSYCFLIPETPRWLLAVNRTDEAVAILERVAKINKRPPQDIKGQVDAFQAAKAGIVRKKGSILDLFRTPNLRKNILVMSFNWLSCSYCFFGVSQYVGQLSGDVFLNVAASAAVTFIGCLLSIPLMKIMGRKTLLIVFNFVCAACLFALAFMPDGYGFVYCASVSSFILFIVVYLYCTELFPTVVRNAALGFSSMAARIGAMIAPFMIDMRDIVTWLPPVAFAISPFIAGCLTFLLPETKGCELMSTLEEGERFGKLQPTKNR